MHARSAPASPAPTIVMSSSAAATHGSLGEDHTRSARVSSLHRMRPWRYPLILGGVFVLLTALFGIRPTDRHDWLLENVIAFIFVLGLAVTARGFRFSRFSYTLIFVFLCLHAVGAHYTYSGVPYDE